MIKFIPRRGQLNSISTYKGELNGSAGIYILSQLKNREEFDGGLEKRKGKGGERRKKEKSDKIHVKIPL